MAERKDHLIKFDRWLPCGDTIKAVDFDLDDDSLWGVEVIQESATSVRVWLDGGNANQRYDLHINITTEQGRRVTFCLDVCIGSQESQTDNWLSSDFINRWADRIYADCRLGY